MMEDSGYIKALADELGFALCGVCEARETDYRAELERWLAEGRHGEMDWLARNVEVRADPRELLAGARSVICVADFIGPEEERETRNPKPEARNRPPETGNRKPETRNPEPVTRNDEPGTRNPGPAHPGHVARYAQVDDYHKIIKKRLHRMCDALLERWPGHRFRACVDTAPILEREHAMRAGLGWVGKHTLLLNRRLGSHLLLGEIVTTLPIAPDEPETDHCGTCTRCIDACPTDCITPYSVDASRCISYLTIEHRNGIEPAFHEAMGDWLYGCDICQQVCPFNSREMPEGVGPPEVYGERPAEMDVLEVLRWGEEDRRGAFVRSAMKRAKLDQMKRNAVIVAGNRLRRADDAALRRRLETIAADPEEAEMVRRAAGHVLERLAGEPQR